MMANAVWRREAAKGGLWRQAAEGRRISDGKAGLR